jgi:hypothetical protein
MFISANTIAVSASANISSSSVKPPLVPPDPRAAQQTGVGMRRPLPRLFAVIRIPSTI